MGELSLLEIITLVVSVFIATSANVYLLIDNIKTKDGRYNRNKKRI